MRFGRRHEQALLETFAAMDLRYCAVLARHEENQQAVFEALTALRHEVARRETALADTFACVVATCNRLAKHVDDERAERSALAAAVDGLTLTLAQFVESVHTRVVPQVVGGTFYGFGPASALGRPTPDVASDVDTTADVIDVVDIRDNPITMTSHHVVEVHCRFGDKWVDGFEVCERIADNDCVRYRLRRRSDGSVLPTVFSSEDVREVRETRREDLDAQKRRWSVTRP